MRTLVTGADGFIGRHCMAALADQGIASRADIRNVDELVEEYGNHRADAVIHLASQSSVAQSFVDPIATHHVNFLGTLNVLTALQKTEFGGRFLFVSSGDCYGLVADSELPIGESRPLRPRNPYAVSKIAAEALCYQWSQTGDFEVVIARPFNQAGPGQSPSFVVSDIGRQCAAIRRGSRPPEITLGNPDVSRDFTDVRDGVRAFQLLVERGRNGEAYNVCSGVERSIREVVDAYSRLLGVPLKMAPASERLRRAEQLRMRGSFDKLREHTGWRPSVPLEQTLSDILDYWSEADKE
jgi:GDP-4-dehydro-6-deoxy-D-mannose reductase